MVRYPFEEKYKTDFGSIRVFKSDVEEEELKWHRDRENRIIESVGMTDWKIQIDNELPKRIEGKIEIPEGVWHRVIKGSGDLTVRIDKF